MHSAEPRIITDDDDDEGKWAAGFNVPFDT